MERPSTAIAARYGCTPAHNATSAIRAFERTGYRFDVMGDYGAFRDLQRHRMLTVQWQSLTPDLGAGIPEQVELAGCGDDYRRALLDLAYEEDSRAEVDMNVVMTGSGDFVEIQASAEGRPFAGAEMQDLLALAAAGIRFLNEEQRAVLPTNFLGRKR